MNVDRWTDPVSFIKKKSLQNIQNVFTLMYESIYHVHAAFVGMIQLDCSGGQKNGHINLQQEKIQSDISQQVSISIF